MKALDTFRLLGVEYFNEKLQDYERQAVRISVDRRARDAGFTSEAFIRENKRALWEQWVGEEAKKRYPGR